MQLNDYPSPHTQQHANTQSRSQTPAHSDTHINTHSLSLTHSHSLYLPLSLSLTLTLTLQVNHFTLSPVRSPHPMQSLSKIQKWKKKNSPKEENKEWPVVILFFILRAGCVWEGHWQCLRLVNLWLVNVRIQDPYLRYLIYIGVRMIKGIVLTPLCEPWHKYSPTSLFEIVLNCLYMVILLFYLLIIK